MGNLRCRPSRQGDHSAQISHAPGSRRRTACLKPNQPRKNSIQQRVIQFLADPPQGHIKPRMVKGKENIRSNRQRGPGRRIPKAQRRIPRIHRRPIPEPLSVFVTHRRFPTPRILGLRLVFALPRGPGCVRHPHVQAWPGNVYSPSLFVGNVQSVVVVLMFEFGGRIDACPTIRSSPARSRLPMP